LIDEQQLLPIETISETPESSTMLTRLKQIGLRTANFHQALASRDDIPEFAPEQIARPDMARWVDALLVRVRNVVDLLKRRGATLSENDKARSALLQDHHDDILRHIDGYRCLPIDAMKIRHHGDFHLGQVLIVKDDAYLLDFEGEPRRSLEDRRRKAPAARDVAGFCRSIDYATSAALNRVDDIPPDDKPKLATRMRLWSQHLIEAYWNSYRETLTDNRLWPRDEEQSRQLLDFFLLEKAFYEIEYELTNRPAWVGIPLEATLRILRQRGVAPS
jgi:maltose alpha-D-glucosyltransferase/alpha-amylase